MASRRQRGTAEQRAVLPEIHIHLLAAWTTTVFIGSLQGSL
jgi:hypothetical protein